MKRRMLSLPVVLFSVLSITGCVQNVGMKPSTDAREAAETAPSDPESPAASGRTLYVEVAGHSAGKGPVYLALYDSAASFHRKPLKKRRARMHEGVARADFGQLPGGTFAVSVFLDQNGNGELDRGMMGIPLEPVGNSNNAGMTFGPPDFEQTSIELAGDTMDILVLLVCPAECIEPWPPSGQ